MTKNEMYSLRQEIRFFMIVALAVLDRILVMVVPDADRYEPTLVGLEALMFLCMVTIVWSAWQDWFKKRKHDKHLKMMAKRFPKSYGPRPDDGTNNPNRLGGQHD